MYNIVKIQTIFNATLLLGSYPEFQSYVFNEDVKDVQNIHGHYWETKQNNLFKAQDVKIVVGVRSFILIIAIPILFLFTFTRFHLISQLKICISICCGKQHVKQLD